MFYTISIWTCYFLGFISVLLFSFTEHLGVFGASFLCQVVLLFNTHTNGAGPWHFAIIAGYFL